MNSCESCYLADPSGWLLDALELAARRLLSETLPVMPAALPVFPDENATANDQ